MSGDWVPPSNYEVYPSVEGQQNLFPFLQRPTKSVDSPPSKATVSDIFLNGQHIQRLLWKKKEKKSHTKLL